MPTGAITSYIDVAQVALYVFWVFFALLVLYLHRENKREGYPLVSPDRRNDRVIVQGFPAMPPAKAFLLGDGRTYLAPPGTLEDRDIPAVPAAPFPGAPLRPTGNPMIDGIGTASYANREDVPDQTAEGEPRMLPLRVDRHHYIVEDDPNPIGMTVIGADRKPAGTVVDIWVDRSEPAVRYLEVEVPAASATGKKNVLFPMPFAKIHRRTRTVSTGAITAAQFHDVPETKNPDLVTKLEEDKITGYFAGGYLYAWPGRSEPLI